MNKSVALPLFTALALLFAKSALADKVTASATVTTAATAAAEPAKSDGPEKEYLDGSWFAEPYDYAKYKVVKDNQAEYVAAKGTGDWVKAEAFSPFTYVKGWMHLAQARELKYEALKNKDVDALKQASQLYLEAKEIGEKAQAVVDLRGDGETQKSVEAGKLIVEQAETNITGIAAAIDSIQNPPAKKSRRAKKAEAAEADSK